MVRPTPSKARLSQLVVGVRVFYRSCEDGEDPVYPGREEGNEFESKEIGNECNEGEEHVGNKITL